ncbi:tyrosine-protein phosphatase [Arabiibacter massiliensis]|uniref:tyrosine-protein phosphatase n=1 Tax=Arabiibacter massiliensis TaxID=1870985 RepID=UPI0009B95805|nr:tyrosine-protein phosphatase [Arabiibacter massiliensis]
MTNPLQLEREPGGRIVLEGLPNTRDVGGIPAADGRFVKHARLIRSGALHGATDRDLATLTDDFRLRLVIDLRTEEERREKPDPEDRLPGVRFDNAPLLSASTFGVTREGGMMQALKALRTLKKNPASIMENVYERMVLDEQSQQGFAQFFADVLAAEEGAVLWHCTIGKDRAGLAAALLLHALGAPRDAIERDYLATNEYVKSETQNIMDALSSFGLAGKLDDSIHVINSADARFLNAAFDAIEREYSSLDAYVRDQLHVSDAQRETLRTRYLTDAPQG